MTNIIFKLIHKNIKYYKHKSSFNDDVITLIKDSKQKYFNKK